MKEKINYKAIFSVITKPQVRRLFLSLFTFFICVTSSQGYAQEQRVVVIPSGDGFFVIPFLYTAPPEAPSTLGVTVGNDNDATVSWNPSPGAQYYELEWFNPDTGKWETVYSGSATSFTTNNLAFGANKFRVKACADSSCGDYSSTTTVSNTSTVGSPYYGTLTGQQAVAKDGSFNYSVPLDLPPGINGVQPNLALSYNSNRGNGLVGWGWQLDGLPSIARCSTSKVRDNYVTGTNPGENYRYCLNGDRLVKTGSNEYRLETESFARLSFHSSYWEMRDRNGTRTLFASASNARRTDGAGQIRAWHVSEVRDVSGNYYSVAYTNNGSNGVFRPSSISYTQNSAGGSNHSITFFYQARTDVQRKYLAGGLDLTDQRLATIIVKTNNAQVYRYNLAYQSNGQTYNGSYFNDPASTSRLRSIQRCYNATNVCSSALSLGWSASNTNSRTLASRWSGASVAHKNFTNAELAARGIGLGNIEGTYIADATGDQVDDYIVAGIASTSPTYKTVWYFKNGATGAITGIASYDNKTGPGEFSLTGSSAIVQVFRTLSNPQLPTSGQRIRPIFADVTGDGKNNIILPSDPGYVNTSLKPIPNGIVVLSMVNNKLVYHAPHSLGSDKVRYSASTTNTAVTNASIPYRLVYQDFNGDGLTDILRHAPERPIGVSYTSGQDRNLSVAVNTGSGFAAFQSWASYASTPFANEITPHPIDLNGDKLVDLVLNNYVAINSGSGFTFKSNWGINLDLGDANRGTLSSNTGSQAQWEQGNVIHAPGWIDVNNDGLVDRVTLVSSGTNRTTIDMRVQFNQGYKLASEQSFANFTLPRSSVLAGLENTILLRDFNGDGLPDLVATRRDDINQGGFDIRYRRGTGFGSAIRMTLGASGLMSFDSNQNIQTAVIANICSLETVGSGNISDFDPIKIENNCGYQSDRNLDGLDDYWGINPFSKHQLTSLATGSDYSIAINYDALAKQAIYSLTGHNQNTSQFNTANQSISTNTNFSGVFAINAIDNLTNSPMSGRYAVSRVTESNGIGDTNRTDYAYTDAAYHGAGYGNLGFAKRTENSYAGSTRYRQKETQYLQEVSSKYNLAGYAFKERNWVARSNNSLRLTSEHDYQWQVRTYNDDVDSGYDSPHFHPYQVASLSNGYDLESGSRVGSEITKYAYDSSDRTDCNVSNYPRQITADTYFYAQGVPKNVVKSKCDAFGVVGSRTENTSIQSFYAYGLPKNRKTTYWSPKSGGGMDTRLQEVAYTYNSKGQTVTERLEPNSGDNDVKITRTYAYNGYGSASSTTESWANTSNNGLSFANRQTTVAETYPSGARQLVITNPLSQTVTQRFDSRFGLETYLNDVNNQTFNTSYDALGRILKRTEPNSVDTNYSYAACSGCFSYSARERWYQQSTRDGEADVRTYFDGLNRNVGTRDRGLTNLFTYTGQSYDGLGRVLQTIEPLRSGTQHKTTFAYDYLDRTRSTSYPNGGTQSIGYGVSGTASVGGVTYSKPRVFTTDSLGRNTQKFVDTNEQIKRIIDARNTDINYVYDPLGNLTEVELQGNKQIITYDQRSRKKSLVDPGIGTITYKYNPLGELGQESNSKNEVTRYQYDKLARQTRRTDDATGSAKVQNYAYDGSNGKGLISAISGIDTQGNLHAKQFFYNGLGLLDELRSTIDGGTYSTSYTYDSFNRPDTLSYPTGFTVQHGYSSTGRRNKISNANTNTVYWMATADDARGNITSATLGNGLVDSKSYDPKTGLINTAKATGSSYTAQDQVYQWDTEGNLTLRQDKRSGSVTQRFCYDDLSRIKKVTSGTCTNTNSNSGVDFAYSDIGNLTNKQGVGYGYGAGAAGPHAVTSAAGRTYTYDANGSMTGGNNRTISYTAFGKPASITKGANSVDINYGADKSRIQRDETNASGTSLTTYISHDLVTTYERVEKGGESKYLHYINAPNGRDNGTTNIALYSQTQIGGSITDKTIYHHRDHLGSTVAKTDDQGNLTSTTELLAYDTWGKRLDTNWNGAAIGENYQTEGNQRGYTDHEHLDSVGLIHMNGRVYDPELARFISPDPWIQDPYNTQSFNRYSYVWNNPLRYTDPTGEVIPLLVIGAIKVIGYASAAYGAYEAANTVHDIATGEKSLEEGAKDLAVDAALTVTGLGLAKAANKFTPDSVKDKIKDKISDTLNKGDDATKSVSKPPSTSADKLSPKEQLQANQAQGKAGEAEVRNDLGSSNRGEQVTVETLDGDRARVDFVSTKDGQPNLIEVKTGNAKLSKGQTKVKEAIDRGEPIIPRGQNARRADLTPDEPVSCSFEEKRC